MCISLSLGKVILFNVGISMNLFIGIVPYRPTAVWNPERASTIMSHAVYKYRNQLYYSDALKLMINWNCSWTAGLFRSIQFSFITCDQMLVKWFQMIPLMSIRIPFKNSIPFGTIHIPFTFTFKLFVLDLTFHSRHLMTIRNHSTPFSFNEWSWMEFYSGYF